MPYESHSTEAILLWLSAYSLAIASVGWSCWLATRPAGVVVSHWNPVRISWLLIITFAVVDGVRRGKEAVLEGDSLVLLFPIFIGGITILAAMGIQMGFFRRLLLSRTGEQRPFHVFGSIAILGAVAFRFGWLVTPVHLDVANLPGLGPTAAVTEVHAVTDQGHAIPLRHPAANGSTDDAVFAAPEGFACRIIDEGVLDENANCHGWVFTEGHYFVSGTYVDAILSENGYEQVRHPRVDDLIVYRDHDGRVVHTGRVKAIGREGFTLIESKWGAMHLYLHLPDDQCYSAEYAYYRSPRSGHLLRIVDGAPPRDDVMLDAMPRAMAHSTGTIRSSLSHLGK